MCGLKGIAYHRTHAFENKNVVLVETSAMSIKTRKPKLKQQTFILHAPEISRNKMIDKYSLEISGMVCLLFLN